MDVLLDLTPAHFQAMLWSSEPTWNRPSPRLTSHLYVVHGEALVQPQKDGLRAGSQGRDKPLGAVDEAGLWEGAQKLRWHASGSGCRKEVGGEAKEEVRRGGPWRDLSDRATCQRTRELAKMSSPRSSCLQPFSADSSGL